MTHPYLQDLITLQLSLGNLVLTSINESNKGRRRQGTAGVVNGTLLIFTRPRVPGIANSSHGVTTRFGVQGQSPGGKRAHGSWKPLALMVTEIGRAHV